MSESASSLRAEVQKWAGAGAGAGAAGAPGAEPGGETFAVLTAEIARLVGSPQEAEWIVETATGSAARVLRGGLDARVDRSDADFARELAGRRATGEPLQHVLGSWGFRRLLVEVDARALVPRPETEIVVEAALGELEQIAGRREAKVPLLVADLGTGSGVIALAILDEQLLARVIATDVSEEALSLAAANVLRVPGLRHERIELRHGSWFEPLASERGLLDMIVSNPPYIAEGEWSGLDAVVRDHDPYGALVAGPSGLEAIAEIVASARRWLRPDGALVVEIAPHQDAAALEEAASAGFASAEVQPDLVGRPRVLVARR